MNVSQNGGTVAVNDTLMTSNPAIFSFISKTQAKIEAIPAPGYRFFRWGGYLVSKDNPATIDIDCSKNITAVFERIAPVLTIEGHGQGSVSPSPGDHSFWQGAQITLTASPADGWKFDGWSNNVDDPSSPTTTLTLNTDTKVTANFIRFLPVWLIPGLIITGIVFIGAVSWLLFRRRLSVFNSFIRLLKNDFVSLLFRLILGSVLLFAGIVKVNNISALIAEIEQYQILPSLLASVYGSILPFLEIIIGIFLLLGIARKVSAAIAGLIFLSFIIAKIVAITHRLDIDICNCFGPAMPLL